MLYAKLVQNNQKSIKYEYSLIKNSFHSNQVFIG